MPKIPSLPSLKQKRAQSANKNPLLASNLHALNYEIKHIQERLDSIRNTARAHSPSSRFLQRESADKLSSRGEKMRKKKNLQKENRGNDDYDLFPEEKPRKRSNGEKEKGMRRELSGVKSQGKIKSDIIDSKGPLQVLSRFGRDLAKYISLEKKPELDDLLGQLSKLF